MKETFDLEFILDYEIMDLASMIEDKDSRNKILSAFYENVHSGESRGKDYVKISFNINTREAKIIKPKKAKKLH